MFGRKKVSRRKRGMRKPIPIAPALVFQQLSVSLASSAATSITPSISEPIPIAPAPVFQPLSMPIASSAANYFPPFIPNFAWTQLPVAVRLLTRLRIPNSFCSSNLYYLSQRLSAEFLAAEVFGFFKQQMFRYKEEKQFLPGFDCSAGTLLPRLLEKVQTEKYDPLIIFDLCVAQLSMNADMNKETIEQKLLPYFRGASPLEQFEEFNSRRLTRNEEDTIYRTYQLFLRNNMNWVVVCIVQGLNTGPEREWLMQSTDLLSVALLPEERLFKLLDRVISIDLKGVSHPNIETVHLKFFVGLDEITCQSMPLQSVSSFVTPNHLSSLNVIRNSMPTDELLTSINLDASAFQSSRAEDIAGLLPFLERISPNTVDSGYGASLPQRNSSMNMQVDEQKPSCPVAASSQRPADRSLEGVGVLQVNSSIKRSGVDLEDSVYTNSSFPRSKRSAESPIFIDILAHKPRLENSDLRAFMNSLKTGQIERSFYIQSNDGEKTVRYIPFFDNPLVFEEEQK